MRSQCGEGKHCLCGHRGNSGLLYVRHCKKRTTIKHTSQLHPCICRPCSPQQTETKEKTDEQATLVKEEGATCKQRKAILLSVLWYPTMLVNSRESQGTDHTSYCIKKNVLLIPYKVNEDRAGMRPQKRRRCETERFPQSIQRGEYNMSDIRLSTPRDARNPY